MNDLINGQETEEQKRRKAMEALIGDYTKATENADADLEAARAEDRRARMIATIGEAVEGLARANSVSRGGRPTDSSFYRGLADSSDAVKTAILKRQQGIAGIKDKFGMQKDLNSEDRSEAELGIKKADSESTIKKNDSDIENTKSDNAREDKKFEYSKNKDTKEFGFRDRELRETERHHKASEPKVGPTTPGTPKDPEQAKKFNAQMGEEKAKYKVAGGDVAFNKMIKDLKDIQKELKNPNNKEITGRGIDKAAAVFGSLPGGLGKPIETYIQGERKGQLAMKQRVQAIMLPAMKLRFGPNPTDSERKAFFETLWDDRLSPEENVSKLEGPIQDSISRRNALSDDPEGLKAFDASLSSSSAPLSVDDEIKKLEQELGLGR